MFTMSKLQRLAFGSKSIKAKIKISAVANFANYTHLKIKSIKLDTYDIMEMEHAFYYEYNM